MMDKITLEEFKKNYMGKNSKWQFDKFKIVCNKCNSNIVEFNGYAQSVGGYYGEHSLEGFIVVKCHECGNGFVFSLYGEEFNTDGENIKRFHEGLFDEERIRWSKERSEGREK